MMKQRLLVAFGLASLLTGLLAAQDELQFAQGIGAQYDSKLGFVPSYRVELTAPLVRNPGLSLEAKVSNDFAVLADTLAAALTANFRLAPWVAFALETPVSVTYRIPTDLSVQVAGSAKLALGNQPEPEGDAGPGESAPMRSGWALAGELSSTASVAFGNIPPGQGILYQAASQLEVGYQSAVVSPNLKLVATADLGALKLEDVKSLASLSLSQGTKEQSATISAETSLYAGLGDTKVTGQVTWGHLLGSASLGVSQLSTSPKFDYNVGVGYRF